MRPTEKPFCVRHHPTARLRGESERNGARGWPPRRRGHLRVQLPVRVRVLPSVLLAPGFSRPRGCSTPPASRSPPLCAGRPPVLTAGALAPGLWSRTVTTRTAPSITHQEQTDMKVKIVSSCSPSPKSIPGKEPL